MIHLDTSFLIRALVSGSPQDRQLRAWLRSSRGVGISAVGWAEFLCGPIEGQLVELAARIVREPVAFLPQVSLSARAGGLGDIAVTTKGAAAFVPALPLPQDPSATVHLRSSQGQCWGATFSAPAPRNNAVLFKDSLD